MQLLPNDTLLLVSSAAFGMCEVTVMLSCEDSASSGAAAEGTDAVCTASFVSEASSWPFPHLQVTQLLLTGLSYVKLSINVGN